MFTHYIIKKYWFQIFKLYFDDVDSIAKAHNLRYIIIDSIYDRSREKGICVNQIPKDSSFVKKIEEYI